MQRRLVEGLLHVHVNRAGNVTHLARQLLRDREISDLIVAHDRHVDRRGRTEVQNLRDDVGGLEEELNAGETLAAAFPRISLM